MILSIPKSPIYIILLQPDFFCRVRLCRAIRNGNGNQLISTVEQFDLKYGELACFSGYSFLWIQQDYHDRISCREEHYRLILQYLQVFSYLLQLSFKFRPFCQHCFSTGVSILLFIEAIHNTELQ